jgi:hypothetical protein
MGDRKHKLSETSGKSEKRGKEKALEQELITHYASRVMEF